nr:hypothetical protein [Rodentibacter heylii]
MKGRNHCLPWCAMRAKAMQTAAQKEEDSRIAEIQFVERYSVLGKLEFVENTPEFAIWKVWKTQQEKGYAA